MTRRQHRPDHDAGLHPRCLECGSTGGRWCGGNKQYPAYRIRGLCHACYSFHRYRATLDQFAATPSYHRPEHPDIPRGYLDPYMLGCTRDQHAVVPGGWDWAAVVVEAELFAAAYLASKALEAA